MTLIDLQQHLLDNSIDAEPLRNELKRRVDAGESTWTGMARQLGWVRYKRTANAEKKARATPHVNRRYQCGDGSRLKRAVGAAPYYKARLGGQFYQARITFELAEFICRGLDIDMVEIGL